MSPGPQATTHEPFDEPSVKVKSITITEDSVETHGFGSIYELIGFIHLKCRPELIEQAVMLALKERKDGGA